MSAQSGAVLFVASWTIAELWHGVLLAPPGKKRDELEKWYSGSSGPLQVFSGRILDFDVHAAQVWAELMFEGRRLGRPRGVPDTIIAAIAVVNNCVVVTGNDRDFWGIEVINPFLS